jgi:parvulin-like peptidyl-prolyl isomerase
MFGCVVKLNRTFAPAGASALLCLGVATLPGCSSQAPTALNDSAFMPRPGAAPASATSAGFSTSAPPLPAQPAPATQPVIAVNDFASAAQPASATTIAPLAPAAAVTGASTPPSPSATDPLFMTLGGVVAEVNGTPVYANTVLALLNAELAAKAKEMDADTFRDFARGELVRQREASIADEAEFAAAELQLSDDDKKLAKSIAVQNRQKLITSSGGSVELARAKVAADGQDFDDYLQQQYRRIMQEVYYQRKIMPRIQISAADMRTFYDAARDRLYSSRSSAIYRVIKIDPQRIGGAGAEAAARQRAEQIRQQAMHGADFATLASNENQDDFLKSRAGDPGCPMQRDSYRIDAVDKAVWQLQPGQVTPVIESDGAFWLAKLEARNDGRTRPFDDQSVQDDIHNRLWQQQFEVLRDGVLQQMELDSVGMVRRDDALLQPALDMAMQEYARWRGVRQ